MRLRLSVPRPNTGDSSLKGNDIKAQGRAAHPGYASCLARVNADFRGRKNNQPFQPTSILFPGEFRGSGFAWLIFFGAEFALAG